MFYTPPVPGGHPDLCFHNGTLHYAYQDASTLNVCTSRGTTQIPLGTDVLAFPRVISHNGNFCVLYREGKSRGGHALLLRDGQKVFETPYECGGNNPVSFGYYQGVWIFACVEANTQSVHAYRLDTCDHIGVLGNVPGTGIAHITTNRVVSWDENNGSQLPHMTAPTFAGRLVCGEHPTRGARVRHTINDKELILFPNDYANTPRIAMAPDEVNFAVAVWGPPGVRIATFHIDELVSITAPYPPGRGWTRINSITEIHLQDYLFPLVNWSRVGAHIPLDGVTNYTHQMQSVYRPTGVQHTKVLGDGARSALWTVSLDGMYWGLSWDATDQKNGYRIVIPGTKTTAQLYPSVMSVGVQHMRTVNVDILTPDGNRRNVNWRGYVEGMYEGPQVGVVPLGTRWANIVWDFDDPNGYIEQNMCAKHLGPIMWFETKKSTNATRRWFGVNDTPRVPDPIINPEYEASRPMEVAPTPKPPRVDIKWFANTIRPDVNTTIIDLQNGANPSERVKVELIDNSIHATWTNEFGTDRSGRIRHVDIIP